MALATPPPEELSPEELLGQELLEQELLERELLGQGLTLLQMLQQILEGFLLVRWTTLRKLILSRLWGL